MSDILITALFQQSGYLHYRNNTDKQSKSKNQCTGKKHQKSHVHVLFFVTPPNHQQLYAFPKINESKNI
jgi:hypothetical protein